MSLMVKPSPSRTGSATVNVQQWVDLQILSTITWLSDQITPPSPSLLAEVQSPPPPPSLFKGSAWKFPLELLRLIPALLLLCMPAQQQILLFTPADPRGSRTRRELGKVLFRSVNSRVRVWVDVFDPHTACDQQLWAWAKTANGYKNEWNEEGCLVLLKQGKLNWAKLKKLNRTSGQTVLNAWQMCFEF